MNKPTPKGGANRAPENEELDTQGDSGDADEGAGHERPPSARDEVIARMDARNAESRRVEMDRAEQEGVLGAEPFDADADDAGEEEPAQKPAARKPRPATEESAPAVAGASKEDDSGEADPLADYVILHEGRPMFRAKVDGQERLIPLDTARQHLQKHVAADIRLQQAAEVRRQLDTRATQIQAREADLSKREQKLRSGQLPANTDTDDQGFQEDARDLARALLTAPEDEVTAKLAKVLKRRQAASAPIDVNAIVSQATEAAERRVLARNKDRDINEGYSQFSKDYPEVLADDNLFRLADGMTDAIEQENPSWSPSQVMLEAGRRTREWVNSMRAPTAPQKPNDRQERKNKLKPLPTARSARREAPAAEPEDTPSSVLADIRKARGQG